MKTKNTPSLLLVAAIFIMTIGVVVAFTAELNTSTIYDGNQIPTAISTHILVTMLFVIVSDFLILLSNILSSSQKKITKSHLVLFATYGISGFFFSIASGYNVRSNILLEWYNDMKSAPTWYAGDIVSEDWFESLPAVAKSFSSTATLFYVLTVICAVVTIYLGLFRYTNIKKRKNLTDIR